MTQKTSNNQTIREKNTLLTVIEHHHNQLEELNKIKNENLEISKLNKNLKNVIYFMLSKVEQCHHKPFSSHESSVLLTQLLTSGVSGLLNESLPNEYNEDINHGMNIANNIINEVSIAKKTAEKEHKKQHFIKVYNSPDDFLFNI